jgi:osmotically-inducible protein OsmY
MKPDRATRGAALLLLALCAAPPLAPAADEILVQRAKLPASTEDNLITEKVKAALLKQPELNGSDIDVKTERGRVLLSGAIRNENQRGLALKAAAAVEGVLGVRDALAVR